MNRKIVFLVSRPGPFIENVIVTATSREYAKSHSSQILGGDPDQYIVTPVTKPGARTVFLLEEVEMYDNVATVAMFGISADTATGQEAVDRLREQARDLPEVYTRVLSNALADLGFD